jgi:hypothetical protein
VQSTDQTHQRNCWKLLLQIPSDPAIIASLADIPGFLEGLKASPESVFSYKLRILEKQRKSPVFAERFHKSGGVAALADIVVKHNAPFKGLSLILNMMVGGVTSCCQLLKSASSLFFFCIRHWR